MPAERDDVVETTVLVEVGCGGLRAVDGWKAAMMTRTAAVARLNNDSSGHR